MNKTIFKIMLSLFLSVTLVSCGKKDKSVKGKDTPILSAKDDTYVTAKITRNGNVFNYSSTSDVMLIKAEVSELVMENLITEDGNSGYKIQLAIVNRKTNIDLTEDQKISYAITKEEDGKELNWMTTALFGGDTNQSPKGKFTITKETDTYMEGTFSFKGMLMTRDEIDNKNIVEVTEGQFKAKKLNY